MLSDRRVIEDYEYISDVLASGDEVLLAELEQLLDGFPNGVDDFIGRRWIINAISCGSLSSINWMLSRNVDLVFRDEEGYTVLHAALERDRTDKYQVLELLLQHGASVNSHGINDRTPSHIAAAREDIEALKLLIRFGADLSIRTGIDEYATPLEEARILGKHKAVEFLENLA
jgi:ankyrin repeat protein